MPDADPQQLTSDSDTNPSRTLLWEPNDQILAQLEQWKREGKVRDGTWITDHGSTSVCQRVPLPVRTSEATENEVAGVVVGNMSNTSSEERRASGNKGKQNIGAEQADSVPRLPRGWNVDMKQYARNRRTNPPAEKTARRSDAQSSDEETDGEYERMVTDLELRRRQAIQDAPIQTLVTHHRVSPPAAVTPNATTESQQLPSTVKLLRDYESTMKSQAERIDTLQGCINELEVNLEELHKTLNELHDLVYKAGELRIAFDAST
ncbi:hypothetical protein LTS08_008000 [Lithohypha guttulata]|nr:hypothetical protein LTS08_008000 [Lithohypha guttulata]